MFFTICPTAGMRVMPPTRITSSIFARSYTGVFQGAETRGLCPLQQRVAQLFEFRPRQRVIRCFGPEASAVMNGRFTSVDIALTVAFGFFSPFLQALQRHRILAQVDALIAQGVFRPTT